MTNNDIDKLLEILDNKGLEELKSYLIKEKNRNTCALRQRTFEKYLMTNLWGDNIVKLPGIYVDDTVQIFTNCASIYIINKNFFNFNSSNLAEEKNKKRTYSHRYRLVTKEVMDKFIKKYEENLGTGCFDILFMESRASSIVPFYDVSYVDTLTDTLTTETFSKKEIDVADILLDNPGYVIYNGDMPIIKAESEIGKAYILGCKKRTKK